MLKRNILLTAFRGTSAEELLKGAECDRLLLPNDKVRDSEILIKAVATGKYDYVICFGQRPHIKDKVHIETIARDGDFSIDTGFDCEKLKVLFEQNGIVAPISHNAGTSFCNRLYWNGLQYILQNELDVKMVFVHIPFMKNITEIERFNKKILDGIEDMGK